jgi:NAD+ synthase (glutamine-hydrolysing)
MKLALVQFNPVVGDISGNADRIAQRANEAADSGADLILFPELALVGYPPRDLLVQGGFLDDAMRTANELATRLPQSATVLLGSPWNDKPDKHLRATNSVIVYQRGSITNRYDKRLLPTYDVFDEHRYFHPGERPLVIDVAGVRVGIAICEDLWKGVDAFGVSLYHGADPMRELVDAGAQLVVSPSGCPFAHLKQTRQRDILINHARDLGVPLASINQVGGNDDLIFDGYAAVYAPTPQGEPTLVAASELFAEQTVYCDLPTANPSPLPDPLESDPTLRLFDALVLGLRDYCAKTGFSRAVIGLSGGIDSAVCACIATAALGAKNILGVAMPSRYSSEHSVTDALDLAATLGIDCEPAPINEPHDVLERELRDLFVRIGAPPKPDITEENVQARIRGLMLMAVSNKTGRILLSTGNKSETAVGYSTLYGDMNGGLAVLSDVTKRQVYAIAHLVNESPALVRCAEPPVPESTITKPPSAELRPDQKDQDSLPEYDTLDEIIERYVERRQAPAVIVRESGHDAALVARIVRMIDLNEYKRKQLPIGLKVSSVAFGYGRRRPIAQRYRPPAL